MNQKGFTLKSFLIFIAVIIIILLFAFPLFKNKDDDQVAVVIDFYQEYLNGEVNFDRYLTSEFRKRLGQNETSHNELFLCTPNLDENFEISEIEEKENYFSIITNIPDIDIEVYIKKEDNRWMIDAVACIVNGQIEIIDDMEIIEIDESNENEELIIEDVKEEVSYPEEFRSVIERTKKDLSVRTGITVDEIEVLDVQAVTFSDSSLGISKPGEAYSQVITPGYMVILSINNNSYRYHLNEITMILVIN